MDLGLRGEHALVVGGTAGLGLACASRLSDAGVRVIINGRDRTRGEAAVRALPQGELVVADIGREDERQGLIEAVTRIGAPSIIVTNAGGPPPGQFEEIASSAWRAAFETNVLAALEIVRAFLPAMKVRGFGRVINITSFVVKESYPDMSLSNSLRVALTGAMSSIAREVAPYGITVNGMLPGLMDTGALERVIRDRARRDCISETEARARMAASVPMQRLGTAGDFGALCAFLASPLASYITGQNICVDGGLTRSVI